ncbi:hypothetical protein ACWD00_41555 [Streptomyces viridiviolaceus]
MRPGEPGTPLIASGRLLDGNGKPLAGAKRPVRTGAEPVVHVRPGYARASTARQSLDAQLDSLGASESSWARPGSPGSSRRRSPPVPPGDRSWRPP